MSEYWVSKKKYFCKYCDIYIADDAPSRQQHENGLRHKGNQERFIRGLYKEGERRKKDADEEKREMARVEQAALRAYAQDVGSGLAKASSSKPAPSTSTTPRKPPAKPSNPYTNYSTAESLGYQDPDAERIKAETERRRMQGVAGEWEIVSQPQATTSSSTTNDGEEFRKREADATPDEDERAFKLRRKTLGTGLGEIYDPGIIPIKLKTKKEEPAVNDSVSAAVATTGAGSVPASIATEGESKAITVPKWTTMQWTKAGEEKPENERLERKAADDREIESSELKFEVETNVPPPLKAGSESMKQEYIPLKLEDPQTSGPPLASNSEGSLFKKRRIPANRTQR